MRWRIKVPGKKDPVFIELTDIAQDQFTFSVDGKTVTLSHPKLFPFSLKSNEIELSFEVWSKNNWRAVHGEQIFSVEPLAWGESSESSQKEIRSQMPGRILRVLAKPGEEVHPEQPLIVIEAMKMENEIRATSHSRVKKVAVNQGQGVESGALLLELEPVSPT